VGHEQLVALKLDSDSGAIRDHIGEQGSADASFDFTGDEPAQRPGTVDRVEALRGDEPARLIGDLQAGPVALW
jgi:hypothetical protein